MIPGVDITRMGNKVEIHHQDSGELLAWCWIGDDESVETIADMLSSKRLPEAAMKLRQMAMDARKEAGAPGTVRLRE